MNSSKIVMISMESLISKVLMKGSILSTILLRRKNISLTSSKMVTVKNGIEEAAANRILISIILHWD